VEGTPALDPNDPILSAELVRRGRFISVFFWAIVIVLSDMVSLIKHWNYQYTHQEKISKWKFSQNIEIDLAGLGSNHGLACS
jgi:hypothetical protein